jgi:inner membrane protein involved in colicin E2 resistance
MNPKQSDEFKSFDEVMGGLLAVPYSELQKKLEEEKRTKAKKTKRPTSTASSVRASSSGKKRVA